MVYTGQFDKKLMTEGKLTLNEEGKAWYKGPFDKEMPHGKGETLNLDGHLYVGDHV